MENSRLGEPYSTQPTNIDTAQDDSVTEASTRFFVPLLATAIAKGDITLLYYSDKLSLACLR